MKRWAYWAAATLVLATIAHLCVVLFAPMVDIGRRVAVFETAAPINSFRKVATIGPEASILVEASPDISYAFCRFDISARPLRISAPIPDSYWSVSIYSDTGENLYTINDAQTGARQLQLVLIDAKAPTLEDGAILDLPEEAIRYSSPVRNGLVVVRGFIPDRSLRKIVDSTVASATCTPVAPS